jgi:hypothetical protein
MTADVVVDVLALPPWRLHPDGDIARFAARHVGVPCKMPWAEFCGYLSRGVAGDPAKYPDPEIAKRAEGGWAGGLYREGWRHHTAFVHTQLLTIDVDGHGDVDRAAAAFAPFVTAIHSTYKSNAEAPRCRVVMLLSEPCTDLREYKRAHRAMCESLYRVGYVRPDKVARVKGDIDEGASDATRLSYAPMHHHAREFRFASTAGAPLEIARIPLPTPRKIAPIVPRERNADRYREGALRRAEAEVRSALEGQRHEVLFKEAAALARPELGLSEGEILSALFPPAVAVMGQNRAHEARRTILDGIARGRNGAA